MYRFQNYQIFYWRPFQGDLIGWEAKIVAIFDPIGQKHFDIFGNYGYIFQLFQVLLVIVDSLKCIDFKTAQFYVADPYKGDLICRQAKIVAIFLQIGQN